MGVEVRELREQLDGGAWQGAHVTRAQIIVHEIFTNTIHAHTAQLYSCAETHGVARRATPSLSSSMYCAFARGSPANAPMAYTASFKRLILERLAEGAPPSSPPSSTAVAAEAAGAPAARFLPFPISSLGQLVQPLNKGCIKNLVCSREYKVKAFTVYSRMWGVVGTHDSLFAASGEALQKSRCRRRKDADTPPPH